MKKNLTVLAAVAVLYMTVVSACFADTFSPDAVTAKKVFNLKITYSEKSSTEREYRQINAPALENPLTIASGVAAGITIGLDSNQRHSLKVEVAPNQDMNNPENLMLRIVVSEPGDTNADGTACPDKVFLDQYSTVKRGSTLMVAGQRNSDTEYLITFNADYNQ